LAAACYWALTAIFTVFQKKLETRVNKGYVRGGGGAPAPKVILPGHGGGTGGGAELIEMPAPEPGREGP
jgi:hypothetical protein